MVKKAGIVVFILILSFTFLSTGLFAAELPVRITEENEQTEEAAFPATPVLPADSDPDAEETVVLQDASSAETEAAFSDARQPEETGEEETEPDSPQETTRPEEPQPTPPEEPQPPQDTVKRKKASKKTSVLFIGNSMTQYNNLPEMYASIVKAASGESIYYDALTYSGRSLLNHAASIKAVLRTKGSYSNLTSAEKKYFKASAGKVSKVVFDAYKDALLFSDGTLKEYDYIVLQEKAQSTDYNALKKGAFQILNEISTEHTKIIMNMPFAQMYGDLKQFRQISELRSAHAERLKTEIEASAPAASIEVAYTGRAVSNYLYYAGPVEAIARSPETYVIYEKRQTGTMNDLILGDGIHPTQLCSYLFACVLYSAVEQKSAFSTVTAYRATVKHNIMNLHNLKYGSNYARLSGGISDVSLLKQTAFLAYKTQCENWNLASEKEGIALKKNTANYRYSYALSTPVLRKIISKDRALKLKWKKVKGASRYLVYEKTDYGWERVGTTNRTSYTVKNLGNNKQHTYTVRCVDKSDEMVLSLYDTKGLTGRTLPRAPELKKVVNRKNGVRLSWKTVAGAKKYCIYRKTAGSKWKKLKTIRKNLFTDKTAKPGRIYYYAVKAINAEQKKSKLSAPVSVINR